MRSARSVATRPEFDDVTLFAAPLDPACYRGYAEAGVTRVVFALRPTPPRADPEPTGSTGALRGGKPSASWLPRSRRGATRR